MLIVCSFLFCVSVGSPRKQPKPISNALSSRPLRNSTQIVTGCCSATSTVPPVHHIPSCSLLSRCVSLSPFAFFVCRTAPAVSVALLWFFGSLLSVPLLGPWCVSLIYQVCSFSVLMRVPCRRRYRRPARILITPRNTRRTQLHTVETTH